MTAIGFHSENDAKRRGENLPGRLSISAHGGVTLVELMISMLILAIVCISWLEIIGIQSARKEARRREAVERLAGKMDAFMYMKRKGDSSRTGKVNTGCYRIADDGTLPQSINANLVPPIFEDDVSPIGYQLSVVSNLDWFDRVKFGNNWSSCRWLVGRLYNRNGNLDDVGKPFFTLPVCLGL